ncbi:L-aspartate oxidase [Alteribacillus persepolensis]|uniref:L-aspartate oxidase n=1 Tax=Alteribacillus persepolensis TaxID=568899 RepID=A0A1G8AY56_9BACI|nr:L-aspartate oxidase [Alteribacillus persepolensis]SDH25881.1 L-aspartate oxidase [Alteribacillus persepolensis]
MNENHINTDILIVGSGIAGIIAAIKLAKHRQVTLVTKGSLTSGNSPKAQGGIAAAIARNDDVDLHVTDTLEAGNGVNNRSVVQMIIEQAADVMDFLFSCGVAFDKHADGTFALAKEGAHSCRRIFHAGGDATGYHMMKQLTSIAKDRVVCIEHFHAYDLLMDGDDCVGIRGKDEKGRAWTMTANATILATGGCGQLYSVTSNAKEAAGDGLAMAYRAGVTLTDMEFIQFHPTMLYVHGRGAGLLSEAIRGEGGVLVDHKEHPIMEGKHPLKDLAPRAVVAKAVHDVIDAGGDVFLSIRPISQFHRKFPSIAKRLHAEKVDVSRGLVPVRPGAHFLMGGIAVNAYGQTSKNGLFAIGETACTGMHGANRLASNSLLEGAASALLLSEHLLETPVSLQANKQAPGWPAEKGANEWPSLSCVQKQMDDYAGIVKDPDALRTMKTWLARYEDDLFAPAGKDIGSKALQVKNLLAAAWMVTNAALMRTESRGAHLRTDITDESPAWRDYSLYYEHKQAIPVKKKKAERTALHEYHTT